MRQIRTFAFSMAMVMAAWAASAQSAAPPPGAPESIAPRMLINAGCTNGAVYAVASDTHGNVAAAGYCGDLHGTFRAFVAKLDAGGDVVWTHRFQGATRASNLAFDGAGSVLVAGETRSDAATVGTVIKISAAGVPVWTRTIQPAQPGNLSCASVATGPDAAVYASCGGASGVVVSYSADGTESWRTNAFEKAQSLFSANGRLYAADATSISIIDRATGVVAATVPSEGGAARVGLDGKVYVKSRAAGQAGASIAVYDNALTAIGTVTLTSALGEARSYDDFDVDAAGNIYVLGAYYATADQTGGGPYVAAFGPGGATLWQSASAGAASFNASQSPASLNEALGGSLVSVSASGKCFVSTYLYLLELPAR